MKKQLSTLTIGGALLLMLTFGCTKDGAKPAAETAKPVDLSTCRPKT